MDTDKRSDDQKAEVGGNKPDPEETPGKQDKPDTPDTPKSGSTTSAGEADEGGGGGTEGDPVGPGPH